MKYSLLMGVILLAASSALAAVELVKDGQPVAEIILPENASNFQTVAAEELQRHLEAISGAKLPIVSDPSGQTPHLIHVGTSDRTRALGFSLDDVRHDGFKIVAKDNQLILAGHDIDNFTALVGKIESINPRHRQPAWEAITGEKWRRMAATNFYDYNEELGLYLQDGTGTMFAVYHLLKQLGMRWYMPVSDIGIVYPELRDITINEQETKLEPEFPVRIYTDPRMGEFKKEFFWYKFMKMGASENIPIYHTIGRLVWHKRFEELKPEYFGIINGRRHHTTPNLNDPTFREDFIRYLDLTVETYPDLDYICIGQPDGWLSVSDADKAAGWDKLQERGPRGRFTDFHWDFIMDMREILKEKYPDKRFTVFAYGTCTRIPTTMETIPEDVIVSFVQSIPKWGSVSQQNEQYRDEWQELLPNNDQMIIWEHYLQNNRSNSIPANFKEDMVRSFGKLYDRCLGIMTEVGWNSPTVKAETGIATSKIGITHLMLLLHAELCWDRDLDVEAFLQEYYTTFFGPAADEMEAFYDFVEEVWNRPPPHTIVEEGGWLNKADVERYFELLAAAREKAGDTVYRERIAYIEQDLEPLKLIHERYQRVGPDVKCFSAGRIQPEIDGDIDEPMWRDNPYSFYTLKDLVTGEKPNHIRTTTSFRWVGHQETSSLVVAVECTEPNMENLGMSCDERDSMAIFNDDFVEVQLMTPAGINPKIVVTPRGTVWDYCITANDADLPYDYTIDEIAVKTYEDRWTVEMRIPAEQLSAKVPTKHFPWGIHVSRQRMAGNEPEHFMLSPTGQSFKDTKNMANLAIRD